VAVVAEHMVMVLVNKILIQVDQVVDVDKHMEATQTQQPLAQQAKVAMVVFVAHQMVMVVAVVVARVQWVLTQAMVQVALLP
jgi:uncharacterized membrane protein YkvI